MQRIDIMAYLFSVVASLIRGRHRISATGGGGGGGGGGEFNMNN